DVCSSDLSRALSSLVRQPPTTASARVMPGPLGSGAFSGAGVSPPPRPQAASAAAPNRTRLLRRLRPVARSLGMASPAVGPAPTSRRGAAGSSARLAEPQRHTLALAD